MIKRHYIQDYSKNFRGNTETRTVASDFIRPSIESSLTRRGKKRTDQAGMWTCGEGRWPVALMENRVKQNGKNRRKRKSVTYSRCLHNQQDLYWGGNLKGH